MCVCVLFIYTRIEIYEIEETPSFLWSRSWCHHASSHHGPMGLHAAAPGNRGFTSPDFSGDLMAGSALRNPGAKNGTE